MTAKRIAKSGLWFLGCVGLATISGALTQSAFATTVQFASPGWDYNTADHINWLVNIDDTTTPDYYTVDLSIAGIGEGSTIGDFLGFAFDTTLTGLAATHLTFVSSTVAGAGISNFTTNSVSCNGGGPGNGPCTFEGATTDNFDYLFKIGTQGASGGLVTAFRFLIDPGSVALTLSTFTRVGIRAQTVGPFPNGDDGSVKDINESPFIPPGQTVVPIPAALPLLAGALAGLGWLARRQRRKGSAAA